MCGKITTLHSHQPSSLSFSISLVSFCCFLVCCPPLWYFNVLSIFPHRQVWWVWPVIPASRPGLPAPISTLLVREVVAAVAATTTNTTTVRRRTTPTTLSSTSPLTPATASTRRTVSIASTNSTLLTPNSTLLSPTRVTLDRPAPQQVRTESPECPKSNMTVLTGIVYLLHKETLIRIM